MLTIPFVLPAVNGSWRASLVFWSVPIAVIALIVAALRTARAAHLGVGASHAAQMVAGLAARRSCGASGC